MLERHLAKLPVRPWRSMVGVYVFPVRIAYFQRRTVSLKECNKKTSLGGDFKYFLCSTLFWGNDPIWRAYFSDGLVQPPTSSEGIICHQHPTSNSIQFLAFLRQVAPATTLWWMITVGKSGWKGFSLLDDCYSRGIGRESLGIPHHLGIRNVVSSWLVRLWTANCNHNEVLTWVSHRNHPPPQKKKASLGISKLVIPW